MARACAIIPGMRFRTLAIAVLLAAPALPAAAAHRYHVAHRWTIGGEGGWDYVTADAASRRLYIAHGTEVEVVDLDRGRRIGSVVGVAGAHGIAIAPRLGRGFIASGRDSSLVEFDVRSLAVTGRLHVPARFPDALVFEPVSGRVIAFDGGSANACAFDAASGAFVDSLPLGGTPEYAVADGRGNVFVNIESTSEMVALDARTMRITRRWSLAPGEEPTGLAIDTERHLLFSGCGNQRLVVSDAATGRVADTLAIGRGVDGVAFDPARHTVFSSNGEGTVTVAARQRDGHYAVTANVPTQRGARTVALDEKTGRVFVVTAEFGPTPEPTAERPRPRPPVLPGTFTVLVLDR